MQQLTNTNLWLVLQTSLKIALKCHTLPGRSFTTGSIRCRKHAGEVDIEVTPAELLMDSVYRLFSFRLSMIALLVV